MVAEFWEIVIDVVGGFLQAIIKSFTGVVDIFYLEETGFTVVGQLLLIALGMSIVYFAIRFIRNLIKNR